MEINFYKTNMRIYYRHLLVLLIAVCISGTSFAQEDPTNKQYLFNLLNINPAYAGTRDGMNMTAGFKRQWAGIPGAPQTMIFSADAPFKEHHFGAGLQLYTNSIGLERTSGASMSFSTSFNFTEDDFLSLGIQAGLMNYKIDRNGVALPFQSDVAFQTNTNVMIPTAGIGLYYQRPGFYASLSAPSLLLSTVQADKVQSINSPSLKNMQYILTTGITADLSDDIKLKPSLYMKYMSGKVFDVHINASAWYRDIIGLGASYRYEDAILGILELKVSDKLSFGYSYGMSIGNKDIFTAATHEALIRLNLRSSEY
jgi:type IX secretion system PorP/SprF family membrane protein